MTWIDYQEWKTLKEWEIERKKALVVYMRLYGSIRTKTSMVVYN